METKRCRPEDGNCFCCCHGDFLSFNCTDHGSAIQQVRRGNDPPTVCLFHQGRDQVCDLQALTSENFETTILSVDGIGAHDFISRNAMFQGVRDMVDGDKMINSSVNSTNHRPRFCGTMILARCTTFTKRAGNRETR